MARKIALAASAVALGLGAGACTGTGPQTPTDNPTTENVDITFWHGWTAPNEVKGIADNVERFEAAHPNIHVTVVGDITDDKINQALRAGGSSAPDVVSSFTTDNVGQFCSSHVFIDLIPFLQKSGIDTAKTFPQALRDYTSYKGNQCTLPLLSDAYGLYYNKKAFADAGITAPPKTFSEFDADALKLTKPKGSSFEQLGFMPTYHGYETTFAHYGAQFGITYFGPDGKSTAATDPAVPQMMTWQKALVDKLGGYAKLEKYRTTFGDEFGDKNPFMTGQVAMALDGEWRAGMIDDAGKPVDYAVAPLPVPDDQADTYGKGYLSGTIIGIASTSTKQNAAWELVKYLTTDTQAVVSFANAIHNIPSTFAALESPDLVTTDAVKAFIGIAQHPKSNTTPASPNGGAYQLTLQDVGYGYESGAITDLPAALSKAAQQIDTDVAKAQ